MSPAAAAGQDEVIRRAALRLEIGFRLDLGLRRGEAGCERGDDEPPQGVLADVGNEHALVQVVVLQGPGEALGVEGAGLVAEVGVRLDHVAQGVVGNVEPELARLDVERRFAQHPLQDAAIEARGMRLLVGQRLAQPPLILLQRPLVGVVELLRGNLLAADRSNGRSGEAAQHVADAPDDEADDDEPHDHGHDRLADDPLSRIAHGFEHLGSPAFPFGVLLKGAF